MCMTTVDPSYKWDGKEMVGYKIFLQNKDGFLSSPCYSSGTLTLGFFNFKKDDERPMTEWDEGLVNKYLLGFHFFPTREEARQYKRDIKTWTRFNAAGGELRGRKFVIVKCRFSGIRAKGTHAMPSETPIDERTIHAISYTAGEMTLLSIVR